ncbi:hypothetical protein A3I27_04575 [Candidatus Giovannonibacteria bacterium RIFCSPLOWO2_02_FULL_43_11b]|uniref:F5/8 type C domain-containing protein n=1 Tax=Candidatus Giovannonibacteria bacterium RIFCSPHIGHO2_12_FULL_43_15 TaxID=1798341 RepID=A0A1F5WRD6_9BACT|nr:MAG: hypothetical protein A3B97_00310 [Candidatus Giovannonibacteria bacterium RIFCSPHIGHO2_02_FULL_43_32]OGF78233.1 MAG: hypothetical protein A3F23_02270 [Candidatus Giovannonibacteria bacterium RIFCSPHIGHO2_12_FULL_43_15]OGF90302.1 MAG: hypothetical protein A3I27_04575 [Candidatus Giovannonibacteria bacterium RIFCSPLOWO2_02_FULL_43_11b]OGF92160.1 MAG: hypothetical protein A3H04_01560 [Candidatus Giovannonibacteria bacterium RIFCSPLOWO2_12_FULL_43_11c]
MIKKSFIGSSLLLMLFLVEPAFADFSTADWEYRARILGGSVSGFVTLELPSSIFSYLKSDLSDLRIINQDGEVSYMVAIEKEQSSIRNIASRMFNLSSSDQSSSFILDVGAKGEFHNSVTIQTGSENFRRIVEIEGSNDQSVWRTLNPRGQIFDYTVRDIKPVSVRDTTVYYPEGTFRYLRVTILNQGETPLKISGGIVSTQVSVSARDISYLPAVEILQNSTDKATDVILDLSANGIPHGKVAIETTSDNFSRAVQIYESDDKISWRAIGYAYIFSVNTLKFIGSNLEFSYPESNKRYLKISILNRDDRPIEISGAKITGLVRRILFNFNPSKEYYLYLGNKDAKRPQYDIESISKYVDLNGLNQVKVATVGKNPAFVEKVPPPPPLSERSPYLLQTILGVVVAILAFLLLRIVTNIKKNSSEEPK